MSTTFASVRAARAEIGSGVLVGAGAVGAAVAARYGAETAAVAPVFAAMVLCVLSAIDVRTRRLPNVIVLPAACALLCERLVTDPGRWTLWVAATFVPALLLFVVAITKPAGLGMGDVKLALLLGAALGGAVVPALIVGTILGGLFSAALLVRDGRSARGRTLPYGPFLALGALAVLLAAAPYK